MLTKLMNRLQWFAKPEHQLIPGILFVSLAIIFLSVALRQFKAHEEMPALFVQKTLSGNEIPVHVSMNIQHFSEFNIMQDALTFEGNIWFTFDESRISEKEIESFSFELGQVLLKEKIIDATENGKKIVGYTIKVSLTSNFNYRLFPLDDHRLFIMLANHYMQEKKIRYICEQFIVNAHATIQDWRIHDQQCLAGDLVTKFSIQNKRVEFPCIVYEVDIMRYGYREILLILLPIFAMFFLSMVLFPFSQADPAIMQITASIIAAFIAYRFTVEPLIPKVGYITFADFVFLFFFNLSILVFYCSCINVPRINQYRGFILMTTYIVAIIWLYRVLFCW